MANLPQLLAHAVLTAALFLLESCTSTCPATHTCLSYLPVLEVLNIEAFPWYLPVVH